MPAEASWASKGPWPGRAASPSLHPGWLGHWQRCCLTLEARGWPWGARGARAGARAGSELRKEWEAGTKEALVRRGSRLLRWACARILDTEGQTRNYHTVPHSTAQGSDAPSTTQYTTCGTPALHGCTGGTRCAAPYRVIIGCAGLWLIPPFFSLLAYPYGVGYCFP